MDNMKEEKNIFIVEIIAHQKNTWQGQIHWVQGNKKIPFRSVMEMLRLMNLVILDESEKGEAHRPDMEKTTEE